MFKTLSQVWNSKNLRTKIFFTILLLVIYRLLVQINVPGVDQDAISRIISSNEILGFFSIMTGGSAESFSIIMMGLSPYINASIIMQLLTVIMPSLENLSKEGEQGRRKINKYTRWLTIPLAFLQSYGMIALLNNNAFNINIVPSITDPMVVLPIMLTLTTGTMLIMWLGEIITEKGIGNGISLIIFAGILSQVPTVFGQQLATIFGQGSSADAQQIILFTAASLITIAITVLIIAMTEGQRMIPITYGGQKRNLDGQAALPIKVNQSGMIPIIFAISMVTFPSIVAGMLQTSNSETLRTVSTFIQNNFSTTSLAYAVVYFLLIIGFTYFYVSITFNPEKVADNIQKRGGYIPGVRPGKQTSEYIGQVSSRLNLFGGLFLGFVGISPILLQAIFQDALQLGPVTLIIQGAGLIIIVGVVLELVRQIKAQLITQDYQKFYQ